MFQWERRGLEEEEEEEEIRLNILRLSAASRAYTEPLFRGPSRSPSSWIWYVIRDTCCGWSPEKISSSFYVHFQGDRNRLLTEKAREFREGLVVWKFGTGTRDYSLLSNRSSFSHLRCELGRTSRHFVTKSVLSKPTLGWNLSKEADLRIEKTRDLCLVSSIKLEASYLPASSWSTYEIGVRHSTALPQVLKEMFTEILQIWVTYIVWYLHTHRCMPKRLVSLCVKTNSRF
jgi:hypothetical protein